MLISDLFGSGGIQACKCGVTSRTSSFTTQQQLHWMYTSYNEQIVSYINAVLATKVTSSELPKATALACY